MSQWIQSKKTLQLAGPIILGELVQMALHIIDSAMVGAVSYKHLAAASLVFGIINIPFVFGIGLTVAIAQMVSMASGKNDKALVSHYFFNGMIICTVAGIIIGGGLFLGSDIVYHLNQDAEVAILAQPFLKIMSISLIPMTMFIALKQFADGLEYTKIAMAISLIAMPLNALINWFLIFGNYGFPRLELMGAGWGTFITRTLMLMVMMIYLSQSSLFAKYFAVKKNQWIIKMASIIQLLKIGIPTALQILLEAGAFAISGILVGMISSEAQAAHQIALSTASFTFMVSMGLSQAGSIRISNALGQSDYLKIKSIGYSTLKMALLYGIFCALFFTVMRSVIPTFFNDNLEVVLLSSSLLILAAIFQIPDALQCIAAGALRGVRDVKKPTIYIFIGYWLLGMPLGIWMAFTLNMGASGIWWGFIIGLSFVSIFLATRFIRFIKVRLLSK